MALCALAASLLLTTAVILRRGSEGIEEAWLPRYELNAGGRTTVRLPAGLEEVSGLAVDARGRLLAHNDERGVVYVVDPEDGSSLQAVHLGPGEVLGDFEGIAVAGDRVFLATSGGSLLEFTMPATGTTASTRRVTTELGDLCEVEGLAYDATTAALLLPCKVTRGKALDDRLVVYAVPLATLKLESKPRLSVPHSALHEAGLRGGFHPSAIEVHPRSGSFFILAGRESALVEVGANGRVLAARALSRTAHPQPEGLAFGPDAELWIADESGRSGGVLTRYRVATAGSDRDR